MKIEEAYQKPIHNIKEQHQVTRYLMKQMISKRDNQSTDRSPIQKNGGAGRDRTDDLKLAKLPLSQLSYGPIQRKTMVGLGRLELPTSRLSSARSNQLSYRPGWLISPARPMHKNARRWILFWKGYEDGDPPNLLF